MKRTMDPFIQFKDALEEFETELAELMNNQKTNRLYIHLLEHLKLRLQQIKTKHVKNCEPRWKEDEGNGRRGG